MIVSLMASASLASWVCTEHLARRGFGFSGAEGLGALIDNLPYLLAFIAGAGLAAQSPWAGIALLASHNVLLLALALLIRATAIPHAALGRRGPRVALAGVSGQRIWRMTSMVITLITFAAGVPIFTLADHLFH